MRGACRIRSRAGFFEDLTIKAVRFLSKIVTGSFMGICTNLFEGEVRMRVLSVH